MKRLKTLLLAGALLASPAAAQAKTMALLVGVADYNEGSGIKDLLGPRNDVSILWRALKARGVDTADIAVLTDNLPSDQNYPVAKGLARERHHIWVNWTVWRKAPKRATRFCSTTQATAPASLTIPPSPKTNQRLTAWTRCCCRQTSAPMTRSR